jgi:hypothetical protein
MRLRPSLIDEVSILSLRTLRTWQEVTLSVLPSIALRAAKVTRGSRNVARAPANDFAKPRLCAGSCFFETKTCLRRPSTRATARSRQPIASADRVCGARVTTTAAHLRGERHSTGAGANGS